MSGTKLTKLYPCSMKNVNLSHADLRGVSNDYGICSLEGADLSYANLSDSNLTTVNFSKTNLTGANFENARLVNTDLTNAKITPETNFSNATRYDDSYQNYDWLTSCMGGLGYKIGNTEFDEKQYVRN